MVTNSLKYAFPNNKEGLIKIILDEKDNSLHLVIEDNGVGINDVSSLKNQKDLVIP